MQQQKNEVLYQVLLKRIPTDAEPEYTELLTNIDLNTFGFPIVKQIEPAVFRTPEEAEHAAEQITKRYQWTDDMQTEVVPVNQSATSYHVATALTHGSKEQRWLRLCVCSNCKGIMRETKDAYFVTMEQDQTNKLYCLSCHWLTLFFSSNAEHFRELLRKGYSVFGVSLNKNDPRLEENDK
jgi:hypothetical protein